MRGDSVGIGHIGAMPVRARGDAIAACFGNYWSARGELDFGVQYGLGRDELGDSSEQRDDGVCCNDIVWGGCGADLEQCSGASGPVGM